MQSQPEDRMEEKDEEEEGERVRHRMTGVTYGRKAVVEKDDDDEAPVKTSSTKDAHTSSEDVKDNDVEDDAEKEVEKIPDDPIERAKYERKKQLMRSQAYRQAVME